MLFSLILFTHAQSSYPLSNNNDDISLMVKNQLIIKIKSVDLLSSISWTTMETIYSFVTKPVCLSSTERNLYMLDFSNSIAKSAGVIIHDKE